MGTTPFTAGLRIGTLSHSYIARIAIYMPFNIVDVPVFRSDYDDIFDAISENRKRAVEVPIPQDVSPSSYRQRLVTAMKGRKIAINTYIRSTDCLVAWFRADIVESKPTEEEKPSERFHK